MKIECIVVSYKYGDYLYYTLPSLVRTFDNVIVVTSEDDSETINACKRNNITPIIADPFKVTDAHHIDDTVIFNKGHMIDTALKEHVKYKDWVLITDSDIYFEEGTREKIGNSITKESYLYGAYRKHSPSFQSFVEYLSDKTVSEKWDRGEEKFLIKKDAVIGFFQLTKYTHIPRFTCRFTMDDGENMYPCTSGRASHDDFYFQRCRQKIFLDIDVVHLSERKQNWGGRITGQYDVLPDNFFKDISYAKSIEDINHMKKGIVVGTYTWLEELEDLVAQNLRIGYSSLNNQNIWWTVIC